MMAILLALQATAVQAPAVPSFYRVANKVTIDVGAATAPLVLNSSSFIGLTFVDSAAGRVVNATIYSSTLDGGVMAKSIPAQLDEDPRGATLHGYLVPGQPMLIAPLAGNLQAQWLVSAVQLLTMGARTAVAGERWSDSTSADTAISTGSSSGRLVTTWTAAVPRAGAVRLDGVVTGATLLDAGATRLHLQTAGRSQVAADSGQLPFLATTSTSGQGQLVMGAYSLPVTVHTELSARQVRPADWAQIP